MMKPPSLPQAPPFAHEWQVRACTGCGLVCSSAPPADDHCPRCNSLLRVPSRHGLNEAAAWLIAAMVFYLPATLLPVMHSSRFTQGGDSTLLAGVIAFWHSGDYAIALLIFLASVVIPAMKFIVMSLLLISVWRNSAWAQQERTRLYRLIKGIGYWSMLDVVVVACVCALVQFQAIGTAQPRIGILFFGLVVIMTMLSATRFDPRLIWLEKQ